MGGGLRAGAGLVALAGMAVAIAACSPNDPPGGEGRLSIATGGSGGVYQVYGGGLAEVLTDELPDSPTTAESTSTSTSCGCPTFSHPHSANHHSRTITIIKHLAENLHLTSQQPWGEASLEPLHLRP